MSTEMTTDRLRLRHVGLSDVALFVPLIGDFEVAKNLTVVPHPYRDEDGSLWVEEMARRAEDGKGHNFAVTKHQDGTFIGICSVNMVHGLLDLGYWLGRPFWGRGYATEAAGRVTAFAFDTLGVLAVTSGFYADNPASGHVLGKLGFRFTGTATVHCRSRNSEVVCNRVLLTREEYEREKVS
jgi:RimJ/RimL family protein N-acetyltransferase